jgi:hypothetical protein
MSGYSGRDFVYNQFCKNLKNYIRINSSINCVDSIRLNIAKDILLLTDVEAYKAYKECNYSLYLEIGKFIYTLSKYKEKYPSLNKFIWELWGYGFDLVETDSLHQDSINYMDEKAKLIDLILSTHYFI